MNYAIEGNINFFEELYKSLDDKEDAAKDENNLCLISGNSLVDNFVTLDCKHKFNYVPLYKDLLNYKEKYNSMEACRIKSNQIRCPYCRNIQNKLLPYLEISGVNKVHGINFWDADFELIHSTKIIHPGHVWTIGKCSFYPEGSEHPECASKCVTVFFGDTKTYCSSHLSHMIKDSKKKKTSKPYVKKTKTTVVSNNSENVVLSSGTCKQLLKTGTRKGYPCCAKTHALQFCLRHYKMNGSPSELPSTNNVVIDVNTNENVVL
jgi:hypothetical protein